MTKKKLPAKSAKRRRTIPKTLAKPMKRKRTIRKAHAKPAKRKRTIPKTPPMPVPPPLCAHPRLVHGFLVRPAAMPNGLAAARRPISIDATPANQSTSIPVDVRQEGPADDVTFH